MVPPLAAAGVAVVAIAAVVLGPAGAHPPGEQPKRIWVESGGLYVRPALGAYCWMHDRVGVCADRVYPREVRGKLPVRPRGAVGLIVPDHARSVSAWLTRVRGGEPERLRWKTTARRPTANPHRWRLRLPARLRGADRLDVFVRYSGGDASFSAGIDARPVG
jgi:hypothetical protein